MDTNVMYIEHYVDLHNYISDNIYELNDDVIFTESIWKKVLIGGLAIGGIALIIANWGKIIDFIQKILPKRINKVKEKACHYIYKLIDEYTDEEINNFINKLKIKSNKNALLHIKIFYEKEKNKDSSLATKFYINNDIDINNDSLFEKRTTLESNTKEKYLADLIDIDKTIYGELYDFYYKDKNSISKLLEKTDFSKDDAKLLIYLLIESLIFSYNYIDSSMNTINQSEKHSVSEFRVHNEVDQAKGWFNEDFLKLRLHQCFETKGWLNSLKDRRDNFLSSEIYRFKNKTELFTRLKDQTISKQTILDKQKDKEIKQQTKQLKLQNYITTVRIAIGFLKNIDAIIVYLNDWMKS